MRPPRFLFPVFHPLAGDSFKLHRHGMAWVTQVDLMILAGKVMITFMVNEFTYIKDEPTLQENISLMSNK